MTTVSLLVATIILGESLSGKSNLLDVPYSISFNDTVAPTTQVVSPPAEASRYDGLLYTPTISSKCTELDATIPTNLTLTALPLPSPLIALAPSSNCRDIYVSQAIQDGASAVILYPATNSSSNAIPAGAGAYLSTIPVYFTTWKDGAAIATAMNQYNTDLLDVPFGQNLSMIYPSDSYARLVMTVNRSSSHSLPGLWIFLLIVLGLLCLIVAVTSIAMHVHQFLARRDLRRRIAAGEVDLEGLGIKRLTVPKKYVDALPQRVWVDTVDTRNVVSPSGPTFDQTNCSICLEDYESNTSIIRELPCHHIYHPECIDSFLCKRSSLCPLCKQSVLPKGYIPPDTFLTSATVMRERRRRRLQSQTVLERSDTTASLEMQPTLASSPFLPAVASTLARADVSNLAPDNEEEQENYRRQGYFRHLWHAIFPSRRG